MLGKSKILETTTPSRDVWGQFNSLMAHSFLINLNEISLKDSVEAEGRIKGLITDEALTINGKGTAPYEINSYHRFLITTNNEEPIKTAAGDRRNFVMRSSDELCNNKPYFAELYDLIADEAVMSSLYEYFCSIEDMHLFGLIPLPETAFHADMKSINVSPIESFIKEKLVDNFNYLDEGGKSILKISSKELYTDFVSYCEQCNMSYSISSMQFGVRLKNLKLSGVSTGERSNKGYIMLLDMALLKIHFNLNCLVPDEALASEEEEEE